ncbi:MAG: outer membrane beta-barrel protein [Runella zeae]
MGLTQTSRLIGNVVDSLTKQPLPYATVLLKANNNQQSTLTDINGKYIFKKVPFGECQMEVSYVGYKEISIIININNQEVETPTIYLSLANIQLNEVKVKATKPLFVEEQGKTLVNVAESVLSNAGSIIDVLKYAPSLIINDNSVIIRGKEAIILIDGRQTNQSGESLEAILNAMPSNSIDKIEIISNPSARYDATGKAVINIRTLKMKNLGTTATWTAGIGTGRLPRYNAGILLNHKTPKVSLVFNATQQLVQQYVHLDATRTIKNNVLTSFIDSDYDNRKRNTQFAKLGLDYSISPKTSIGILVQIDRNNRVRRSDGATQISNRAKLDSVITLQTEGKVIYKNWNGNLFFKHQFRQKGRELAIDADYGYYHTNFEETIKNQFWNAEQTTPYRPTLKVHLPWSQPIVITSLRGSYLHPTTKGNFETGFQLRHTTVQTDFVYQTQTEKTYITDPEKSFVYDYDEQVNAAYANYSSKYKKWDYQLGLRLEDSHAQGHNHNSPITNRQNYLQLFPSALLQYTPSTNHQYSVSYSRKITRPSYSALNGQITYINPYRQTIGNPFLVPITMNNLEVNYSYKQIWYAIFSIVKKRNDFTNNLLVKNNVLISQIQNMPFENLISLDVNYRKQINKIWRTNSGVMIFQVRSQLGNFEGINFRVGNSSYIYSNNFFTLRKGLKLDFTSSYVSKQTLGIYFISPFIETRLSIQQSLFHNLGEIRMSISDVVNTLRLGQDYNTITQQGFNQRKVETRYIQFFFTYKFGNNSVKVKERKIGTEKEFLRINNNQ